VRKWIRLRQVCNSARSFCGADLVEETDFWFACTHTQWVPIHFGGAGGVQTLEVVYVDVLVLFGIVFGVVVGESSNVVTFSGLC
jgi:hypothetical protein